MYELAHIVIIPTRTESGEGFNKTSIEAVLSARPIVTSRVWTAWLPFIAEAVLEARSDNPESYYRAISVLSKDEAVYQSKVDACLRVRAQFCDDRRGYAAALRRVLTSARDGVAVEQVLVPRQQRARTADVGEASSKEG